MPTTVIKITGLNKDVNCTDYETIKFLFVVNLKSQHPLTYLKKIQRLTSISNKKI